jgi:hypothetical protein
MNTGKVNMVIINIYLRLERKEYLLAYERLEAVADVSFVLWTTAFLL